MASGTRVRKVTVNLPTDALDRALAVTGKGITPTLVEALFELEKRAHRSALRNLRGKIKIDLDLATSRR